eukprot:3785817-Amphidinium_carterae.1
MSGWETVLPKGTPAQRQLARVVLQELFAGADASAPTQDATKGKGHGKAGKDGSKGGKDAGAKGTGKGDKGTGKGDQSGKGKGNGPAAAAAGPFLQGPTPQMAAKGCTCEPNGPTSP